MHQSVLLSESIDALAIKPNGIYIDGTFGRGGHSQAILDQLGPDGRLIAIDKDPEAIAFANQQFGDDTRFKIVQNSFAEIKNIARELNVLGQVDGVLLDLGVSSPQLDQAERGFSFMKDGPLDMRMNPAQGESVAEFLAHADEKHIAEILWRYGEEKFSRKIAQEIIQTREAHPLITTTDLVNLIEKVIYKREKHKHPATRSFQALRIYINQELADLEKLLADVDAVLAPEGRLAIISFHSLEDRIVKQTLTIWVAGPKQPRHMPIVPDQEPRYTWVARKCKPSLNETEHNRRSRSAILRVVEKHR